MPSEGGRFKAQLAGPRAHNVGWNTAEAVLDLRDEGVIFQAEACREIRLRQFGIRPSQLQPIPSQFAQLLHKQHNPPTPPPTPNTPPSSSLPPYYTRPPPLPPRSPSLPPLPPPPPNPPALP